MKIEKVNDNQIRCTLTREDLAERQIKLSELAYGTEKAKSLFRDMIQQASYECGFEADDIPLMIEAIPLSSDSIILIITKVEYPEELDTRFSQFSEGNGDEAGLHGSNSAFHENDSTFETMGADDILDLFKKIQEERKKAEADLQEEAEFIPLEQAIQKKNNSDKKKTTTDANTNTKAEKAPEAEVEVEVAVDITKLFVFEYFDEVNRLATVLNGFYKGCNALYKNVKSGKYYLVLSKSHHTPEEFNKVCNILSEYAKQEKYSSSVQAYFEEHYQTVLKENALQVLANL